ncbi:MAG: ATP-binding protein, partial [Nanoarchaeota archaeon]|nr:ATP-binding protein [Nanoarchaeota archaeon]
MPYQIPQQLAYKEKIMFGLTFKQLAYAFVFGLLSLLFFKRIDGLYLKFSLVILSSALGVGFMFLNLAEILKDYWVFFRFQREVKGSKKLVKFLGIKDIKDNVIINSKNKKIAVLKIRPINFTMKPKTERDAILSSFQKFLNSLDFPTQILMSTESVELETYFDSLESRIPKNTFEELFDKYKKHLESTVKDSKIMNRVFYIIIPESSDIQIQVDICLDRLGALNLKAHRLRTAELKRLLITFFKGDGKGELIEAISLKSLLHGSDFLNNNGQYNRVIYASGYPRTVEGGFLDRIVSSLGDFDLSLHIKPYPINDMLIGLNRELQKQRGDLYSMSLKGIINPSLEIQYKDTRKTLENLQKGKERLFNIGLYINCKARSLKELDVLTKKVESELNSIMILPKVATLKMLQGFKSVSPLGTDGLNVNRNLTTEALSAFFPFTSQFLEVDDTGVWLGLNKNKIPIIKDIFKLSNPNGVVLAQSGGGKSYFCKLLITRYLLNGTKTLVIDPQGEYRALVAYFKGQRVDLSRESDTMINPFDLMGHDYIEKRLSLIDLMQVMLGDLSEPQKAFIDKAISLAYEDAGITEDPSTWGLTPPILEDVLRILETMEKKAIQLEKTTLRSLINRLDMYVSGVFRFMNKHTNIEFNNRFVCFDIGNMPSQVKPAIMFMVLDYIYMKMKKDLDRKILLIDEAWSLLSRTKDAGYIFEIVKTCRKYNLGLLLINQEVEGLLNSQAGKSVLANSAYTLLMRQKPAVIDSI